MTKTESLFDEVITTIHQRGGVYGHPYHNHKRIADLWSAYLDHLGIKDQLYHPVSNTPGRMFKTWCPETNN
jgi:hypothetical protein